MSRKCALESVDGRWVCSRCGYTCPRQYARPPHRECKPRGLGDTIAKVIHRATGGRLKKCGGCKRRQAAMNRVLPY
jgi:hypothetical protein